MWACIPTRAGPMCRGIFVFAQPSNWSGSPTPLLLDSGSTSPSNGNTAQGNQCNALHSKRLELLRQDVVNISIVLQFFTAHQFDPDYALSLQQMWT